MNSINITKIINYAKNNKLKRPITLLSNGTSTSNSTKSKIKRSNVFCFKSTFST